MQVMPFTQPILPRSMTKMCTYVSYSTSYQIHGAHQKISTSGAYSNLPKYASF